MGCLGVQSSNVCIGLSVALDLDLYSVVKHIIFEQKNPMLGIVGNKEIMKPLSPTM